MLVDLSLDFITSFFKQLQHYSDVDGISSSADAMNRLNCKTSLFSAKNILNC